MTMNANCVRLPDVATRVKPLRRSHALLQALAGIGLASLLAAPAPDAIAAEPQVPVLVRESGSRGMTAPIVEPATLNDPSRIAVRTSAPLGKATVSGLTLTTSFTSTIVKIDQKTKLKLQFENSTSYGYFQSDSKTLSLPTGLVVASPVNVQKTCGGNVTATGGGSSIEFASFTLNSDASCYFEVEVSGSSGGQKEVSAQFTVDFDDGPQNANVDGDAKLWVVANPTTSFSPGTVSPGQTSTLTFTFSNPYSEKDMRVSGSIGLGSLSVSGSPSTGSGCTLDGSAPSVSSGTLSIPGLKVDDETNCTVSLNVSSSTPGSYTVPSSATTVNAAFVLDTACSFSIGEPSPAPKASKSCTTTVTVTPSVSSATLSVSNPAAPGISVVPASIQFGSGAVGLPVSPSQTVRISSTGTASLNLSTPTVQGTHASDYSIASSCPSNLAAGASCTISVTFTPGGPGTRTASLSIPSDAGTTPQVALSGSGASVLLNGVMSFAPAGAGIGASSTLQFTLSNPSGVNGIASWKINYPNLLVNAAIPAANVDCFGSGTLTAASGGSSVTATNFTIPANGSCTTTVSVSSSIAGTYEVVVVPADVSVTVGGSAAALAAPVKATLQVLGNGPTVAKTFSPGSVVAGGTSTLTVTMANPNAAPMTALAFTDTLPAGLVTSGSPTSTCGGTATASGGVLALTSGTMQANGGCSVSVGVTSATAGSYANTLAAGSVTGVVVAGAVANAQAASATLQVTPAPAPAVGITPGSLSFGSVMINSTSASQVATVTNTGTEVLLFAANPIATAPPFGQSHNCPASLVPSQSCAVNVTFSPTAVGVASGELTVASNAPGSPHRLALSGTGEGLPVPAVSFSPASLNFAGQTVATTSAPQVVTLTNSGGATLNLSAPAISTQGDFAMGASCPPSLEPGAGCPITVTFTPLVAGTRTGSVTVASNAPGSPHAASLTGEGIAIPAPTVVASPASLAFPDTQQGTTSGVRTVTLRNGGNAPLVVNAAEIVGAGFVVVTNNCTTVPSIAPGAECALGVVFAPTAVAPFSATLRITSNAPGGPSLVGLSGIGTPIPVGTLSASAATLAFDERVVGTTSGVQSVVITNTGTASATVSEVGISGDFARTHNCGVLAGGATCTIAVTFTPTAVGERSGVLSVTSNASNGLLTVNLTGRGAPLPVPVIEVSASSLTFGNTLVLTAQGPQSVTVRNAGGAPLVVQQPLHVTGEFVASGCGEPVAAGGSCRIDVYFAPFTKGLRPGNLSILSNASNGTKDVSLAGTGCRFEFRNWSFLFNCQ